MTMPTNPLITEARRLRADCNEDELSLDIACLELNSEPESKLLVFAANNLLAFADKIEEIQRSLVNQKHYADEALKTWSINQRNYEAQISQLQAEVTELAGWKESALSVMNSLPTQEIGNLIGVKLGDSVNDKILPVIQALRARVAELEQQNAKMKTPPQESHV